MVLLSIAIAFLFVALPRIVALISILIIKNQKYISFNFHIVFLIS